MIIPFLFVLKGKTLISLPCTLLYTQYFWTPNVGLFPLLISSVTLARCPVVEVNSDTVYL